MQKNTAKIFPNGRSQAVRLPKQFRFNCKEVNVTSDGNKVILTPKHISWDSLFELITQLPSSFRFQQTKIDRIGE